MERETTYFDNRRRIRANRHIRELAADVCLSYRDFIQPLFVDESISARTPVSSLSEIYSDTPDTLLRQIEADVAQGIRKFLLFPVPAQKRARNFDFGFVQSVLQSVRSHFGTDVWVAADLCLCAYTDHGHCGVLSPDGSRVVNEDTVPVLAKYALALAQAGADCIAPSDLMDGRIAAIRNILDHHGLSHIAIMSYAAKFSSQFYGPFRDACRSAPGYDTALKDRKTYQLSPFNSGDGLLTALRDIEEGADVVMVKPALSYLDVIARLRQEVHHPLAAYHVSGEYQALELLVLNGLADRAALHTEVWAALKRAGTGIIISYAARHAAKWIGELQY